MLDETNVEEWAEAQATHPWILRLSPNEELSPELAREIQYILANEPEEAAFEVMHAARLHGQWLQHGEYRVKCSLRLYRKGVVRYNVRDGNLVMARANERCRVGTISYAVTRELSLPVDDGERTTLSAAAMPSCVKVAAANNWPETKAQPGHAVLRFLKSVVLRGAWFDGWAGIRASWLLANNDRFRHSADSCSAESSANTLPAGAAAPGNIGDVGIASTHSDRSQTAVCQRRRAA
jgi:hypothetical protein